MTRILAISDEIVESLGADRLREIRPDVVVSCGDLPFEYLEYIVSVTDVPLAYVLGNHDPAPARARMAEAVGTPFRYAEDFSEAGPKGCISVDGRVVDLGGVRIAGLGGCMRYSRGPNQYTEAEMRRRARHLTRRVRLRSLRDRRGVDVLVTHSPPRDVGDGSDLTHRGFRAFHSLVESVAPKVMVHGHVHLYGSGRVDRRLGSVPVLNAVGYRVVEVDRVVEVSP